MPDPVEAVAVAVLVLTTSIWIGGYVAIVVVARAAAATLDAGSRVAFFRSLGRSYLGVGLPALLVALLTGAFLVRGHDRDALLVSTAAVAVVLLATLAVAVAQARRMTVLRRSLLDAPGDERLADQVHRGARAAGGLRAVLGLLSLALVTLGALLAASP